MAPRGSLGRGSQEHPQRTAAGSPDPGTKAHERARPAPPDVLQRAGIAVGRVAPHHAAPVRDHPHVDGRERDAGSRLGLDDRLDASPQAAAGDAAGAPLDVSRRAGVVDRDRQPSSRALLQHHVFRDGPTPSQRPLTSHNGLARAWAAPGAASARTQRPTASHIAYSARPAASRARARSTKSSNRTIFPCANVSTTAVGTTTSAPLPFPRIRSVPIPTTWSP